MSQSEDVAYNTKTGNCLQTYALGYDSHSTNPGGGGTVRTLCRMGDVTVKMYKLQKLKNNKDTKMA